MKRHIKTIILFLLLLAMAPSAILVAGAALPDYYQDSYYAELPEMYQRLKQTEKPKIVVVGGSNVAFGLDSALLEFLLAEKGFDYAVIPFGLYAAVGTSAMLDLSRNTLREGDIVILALEPTNETMTPYFGATAFWKCAENAPELLSAVNTKKREALAGNYISYLQERYQILASGIPPKAEGVYAKSSFNERCDLVFEREGNAMPLGFDPSAPIDLANVIISPDFAAAVNAYCTDARRAGAQVYLSFCPVNRTALVGDAAETVQSFQNLCSYAFSCPIISNPNDYVLDSGWFYDSNFHLNSSGAVLRTCILAEDILCWLGCYQVVDYPLPEMPKSIAQIAPSTAETGFFTYESISDGDGKTVGYRISGLTEAGLSETQLTAPSVYMGRPVVGFTADALEKATALQLLRLPESIAELPDGLFRGCQSLTQLILEHRTRPCGVSAHTFDGADRVKILVPYETFPLYRDGFGCETNAWTQYLDRIYPF